MSVWAVIVAGGTGERFGRKGGKQLAEAAGRPIVDIALEAFEAAVSIDGVVLVCAPGREAEYRSACLTAAEGGKVTDVVGGGETRQDSVAAGIAAVPDSALLIAVHDGARPLVPPSAIDEAVAALLAHPDVDCVVVGHPVYDTLKEVGPDGRTVLRTVDRGRLWVAQTPQVLRAEPFRAALANAARDGFLGTDDASLVEHAGGVVMMLAGPRTNLKVTVPEDLTVVEAVLRSRIETRET